MLYTRFAQWLSLPSAPQQVAFLALLMSLPAMGMGLVADDYELALAVTRDPWSAYAFYESDHTQRLHALLNARASGLAPWWIDPEFHQRFLRPLSSLSLALDFHLFPNNPGVLHVENALLHAAIVLATAALFRTLELRGPQLGFATFFFAMQAAQSMTVGWISGRSTLLATLFGLLSVQLHALHLRTRRTSYALATSLAFALALASAEAGIAALGYMVALSWVHGAVPAPQSRSTRLRALAGPALVASAWQLTYRLGGYGVLRSGFYIDAASDPLRFVGNLLAAIPIYLASQLTIPYAALSGLIPSGLWWFAALSVAVLAGTCRLWLPLLRRDASLRALASGALLSILPLGSTMPQDRLVSFIAVGVCAVVAAIVVERLGAENDALPRRGAMGLLVLHGLGAPAVFIPYLFGTMTTMLGGGAVMLADALGDDTRPVLLVNAPSHLPVHFLGFMRRWNHQSQLPIDLLYTGGQPVALTRTGDDTLELSVEHGYFATMFERGERDPGVQPFHAGDEITLDRMQVRVLSEHNGKPTRVRFRVDELRGKRLFAWQGPKVAELDFPTVGHTVHIAPASGM